MVAATPPPNFHLIGAQPTGNLEFLRCLLCRTCHFLAPVWGSNPSRRGRVRGHETSPLPPRRDPPPSHLRQRDGLHRRLRRVGGGAYAAVHVNGKNIKNHTIAGKKLERMKRLRAEAEEPYERRHEAEEQHERREAGRRAPPRRPADRRAHSPPRPRRSPPPGWAATRAGTATRPPAPTPRPGHPRRHRDHGLTPRSHDRRQRRQRRRAGRRSALGFPRQRPSATTLYGGVCWDNASRSAAGWLTRPEPAATPAGGCPRSASSWPTPISRTRRSRPVIGAARWSTRLLARRLSRSGTRRATSSRALARLSTAASSTGPTDPDSGSAQ